jgi:hypothetical protein
VCWAAERNWDASRLRDAIGNEVLAVRSHRPSRLEGVRSPPKGVRIHLHCHAGRSRLRQWSFSRRWPTATPSSKATSDRRPSRPASGVISDYARQLRISGFSSATAPLTADRLKKTPSLAVIGIASFVSLLPIALAIMNAKTTVEISTNPLAPPRRFHVENFTSARGKARPSARASFIAPKWRA